MTCDVVVSLCDVATVSVPEAAVRLRSARGACRHQGRSDAHLVNLAIASTGGGSARPAVVDRSDWLEGARSRGPIGRASRASDGGNAAIRVEECVSARAGLN